MKIYNRRGELVHVVKRWSAQTSTEQCCAVIQELTYDSCLLESERYSTWWDVLHPERWCEFCNSSRDLTGVPRTSRTSLHLLNLFRIFHLRMGSFWDLSDPSIPSSRTESLPERTLSVQTVLTIYRTQTVRLVLILSLSCYIETNLIS